MVAPPQVDRHQKCIDQRGLDNPEIVSHERKGPSRDGCCSRIDERNQDSRPSLRDNESALRVTKLPLRASRTIVIKLGTVHEANKLPTTAK